MLLVGGQPEAVDHQRELRYRSFFFFRQGFALVMLGNGHPKADQLADSAGICIPFGCLSMSHGVTLCLTTGQCDSGAENCTCQYAECRNMRIEIGARLKDERERLGMTQQDFAALGGASKRSQIEWEKGGQVPNAEFLAALDARGVDVLYVVTGRRDETNQVSTELQRMADAWETLEMALEAAGRELSPAKKRKAADALYQASKAQMSMDKDKLTELILQLAA
ncbi:helix-turn-helix domain-containing protein [Achromobacter xylosoxidans]|uniref:helix-turn-helix domain-containing protein n=1 Tax=Alcaligenes xylosoxydans xylosoxydans TaxID=85698 RepID=UPI00211B9BC5|nr:helix-turn-helix transcriptional regulator [Achromobacter xylosoxidans]